MGRQKSRSDAGGSQWPKNTFSDAKHVEASPISSAIRISLLKHVDHCIKNGKEVSANSSAHPRFSQESETISVLWWMSAEPKHDERGVRN